MRQYKSTYTKYNIIGTCLCVLSVVPLFAALVFTEDDFVMGGAFGSITFGLSVKYEISPDFMVFGSFSQFDLINSQARDSVKKADEYYAKCDWPIIKIGFSYSF